MKKRLHSKNLAQHSKKYKLSKKIDFCHFNKIQFLHIFSLQLILFSFFMVLGGSGVTESVRT